MRIRILHLLKSLDIGGAERSTIEYTNSLIDHFEFAGIAAKEGFYQKEGLIDKRIDVFNLSTPNLWNLFSHINYFIKIKNIITSNKINILHYHQRIHFIIVFLIKLFLKDIKIVYTHHTIFNSPTNNFLFADKVVAVSESAKSDLPKKLRSKATVIYHGVTPNSPVHKENRKTFNIGFVGRFDYNKGVLETIGLFAKLLEYKDNLRLVFFGEGPLRKNMIKFFEKLSIKETVEIKKPSADLKVIYSEVDLIINLSKKNEAFGIVLIEAMSFGIPVLVSDLECFNEIVEHKKNGFIISDDDETNINELLKFINDKDYLKFFSQQAFNTVINRFNIDLTIKLYKEFYSDLSLF